MNADAAAALTAEPPAAEGAPSAAAESAICWHVAAHREQAYQVRVAEPLLDPADATLAAAGPCPGRRFLVFDDGVPAQWRARVAAYFRAHEVTTGSVVVPGGESFKTMDNVMRLVTAFDDFGLDRRQEPVVIVGGGAVLDTAALAASLYRRGVPHVRVPTTLLAYADAAIGIKAAVNFGAGKNLAGAFVPPELVLLDRGFLSSLPRREVASGLGEILKLGLGCDRALFMDLEDRAARFRTGDFSGEPGLQLLRRAVSVMLRELGPNIYEDDLSRAVDLGHTFSQPFELGPWPDPLRHGEAVAVDLRLSSVISWRRDLLSAADVERLASLAVALGLPGRVPDIDPDLLYQSLQERTRHRGGRQRLPLPDRIGKCVFADDVRPDEIRDALAYLRGSCR